MLIRKAGTVVALLFASGTALAQLEVGGDLLDNCGDIDALQSAGNFSQARDKARLCLQGIEQELTGEVGLYFREEISGWTRTSFEENQVMGFSNISASYEKGDVSVDVSLTGTSGGGGGAGGGVPGLGGLFGGIAQNALLQTGQQVTVAGLPSSLQPDGTLTVPLEDGSLLMFQSNDLDTADAALAGMGDLINAFPVAEINAALQ
jgi:hypothetical protein